MWMNWEDPNLSNDLQSTTETQNKWFFKLRTSQTAMKPTKRATDTVTESLMKVSLNLLSVSTDHRRLLHILLRCCLIFISLRRCVDFLLSLSLPFFVFVFIHMSQSHLFVVLESLKKVAFKLQRGEMLVFVPLFTRLLDIKKSVSLWVVF